MPRKGFYITTAIDYLNGPPHVGHAYERIGADIMARFHRLRGDRKRIRAIEQETGLDLMGVGF